MIETALDCQEQGERHVPRAGALVGGRYLVERLLGAGGMGSVAAAHDLQTGGTVAIKFLLPHCAEEEGLVVRFEREARATERLRSEHVRRVLGSGIDGGGVRYLVMEYLDGEDLRALVRRTGPLEVRRAAEYVVQACRALAEAHALGIVHRDLKPANLFLATAPDGSALVKVVDFGVAKFDSPNVAGDAREMTASEVILGSRQYMAPEQLLAPRSVDALADVWALGAILYFLLAGQTPFAAPSVEEMTLNLLSCDPHAIEPLRPDVPPRLVAIMLRCLQRDRSRRFPNVIELLRALAPFTRDDEPPRSTRGYLALTQDLGLVVLPEMFPTRPPPPPAPPPATKPRAPAPPRAAPPSSGAAPPPQRKAPPPATSTIAMSPVAAARFTGMVWIIAGMLAGALLATALSQPRSRLPSVELSARIAPAVVADTGPRRAEPTATAAPIEAREAAPDAPARAASPPPPASPHAHAAGPAVTASANRAPVAAPAASAPAPAAPPAAPAPAAPPAAAANPHRMFGVED